MVTVGKQDYVKIIDVSRNWTIKEYREFCNRIEAQYNAKPTYFDFPGGNDLFQAFSVQYGNDSRGPII